MNKGKGHKVKGQGQICNYLKKCVGYKPRTDDWILIKLKHRIDINARLKLIKGQGDKTKGQGQICNCVKKMFGLFIMNK